jgi:serine/threonine protein phosphatase 1
VDGSLTYAVGDVHGRSDLVDAMLDEIAADADGRRALVVWLGDYVDRGPDSRGVINRMIAGRPGMDFLCLKGNHEELMLDALRGDEESYGKWLMNGGGATLASYGIRGIPQYPAELRPAIPDGHVAFLEQLEMSLDDGERIFVHAGIRPGVPLHAQDPGDLLWIRNAFLNSSVDHGRLVVHGHTIDPRGPELAPNRINLDTGAYATGVLTCAAFDPGVPRPRIIQARAPSAAPPAP